MPVIRRVQSSRASRPDASFPLEAERLLAAGQAVRAVEICKKGLGYFPEHPTGYVTMARAYFRLGQADRALNVLRDGYRRTGSQRLNALYSQLASFPSIDTDSDTAVEALESVAASPEVLATDAPEAVGAELSVADVEEISGLEALPESETVAAVHDVREESGEEMATAVETVEPEPATAEITVPEIVEPETIQPEIVVPETVQPEIIQSEISAVETVEPEPVTPETTQPEPATPEIAAPETVQPEIVAPETVQPEIIQPEIVEPEIVTPEIPGSETGEPEFVAPELAQPEITAPEIVEPEIALPQSDEPGTPAPDLTVPDIIAPEIVAPDIPAPTAPQDATELPEPATSAPIESAEDVLSPSLAADQPEPIDRRGEAFSIDGSAADLSDIDALDRLAAWLDREHPPTSSLADGGEPVSYAEGEESIALPELSALDMETAPIPLPPEEALEITTILQELGVVPPSVERLEPVNVMPADAVADKPDAGESVIAPSVSVAPVVIESAAAERALVEPVIAMNLPAEPIAQAPASGGDRGMETARQDAPQVQERPRPLSLALHMGKSISRLRSSNLRLIPGLEFAPLRHEDQFRGQSIAPLINEPMPQPQLPPRPRRISDPPVFFPLPTLDAVGVAADEMPPVRADRQAEPEVISPAEQEVLPEAAPDESMEVPVETEVAMEIPLPEIAGDEIIAQEQEPARPAEPEFRRRERMQPEPEHAEPLKLTPLEELARRLENARIPVVEEYEQRPVFEPSIVSDTLASILVAQGAFAEAMQAFQTLARVKPERFEHYQQKIWEMKYRIQNPGMPWPPVEEDEE